MPAAPRRFGAEQLTTADRRPLLKLTLDNNDAVNITHKRLTDDILAGATLRKFENIAGGDKFKWVRISLAQGDKPAFVACAICASVSDSLVKNIFRDYKDFKATVSAKLLLNIKRHLTSSLRLRQASTTLRRYLLKIRGTPTRSIR